MTCPSVTQKMASLENVDLQTGDGIGPQAPKTLDFPGRSDSGDNLNESRLSKLDADFPSTSQDAQKRRSLREKLGFQGQKIQRSVSKTEIWRKVKRVFDRPKKPQAPSDDIPLERKSDPKTA